MSVWGSITVLMTELALEHEQKYRVEKGESHSWQIGTYKQSHKGMNTHGDGIGEVRPGACKQDLKVDRVEEQGRKQERTFRWHFMSLG